MSSAENFRDRVEVQIANGVADVRMIRVDKRNAIDDDMFKGLAEACEYVKIAKGLRAVILRGEGASFCAGLDFGSFSTMIGGGEREDGSFGQTAGHIDSSWIANRAQQVAWGWQEVPVPVIAAVHGHALGGGFQIAMGADIRIVHPDTQLSVREMHWGLFPDMSGTLTISAHVRPDIAKELIFSARVFTGTEGYEIGVVTKLANDPAATAREMAEQIASSNPDAIRPAKRLINQMAYFRAAEQLAGEREHIVKVLGQPNQAEAVMANFEKRKPIFKDRD